jgi:hypothetical protein
MEEAHSQLLRDLVSGALSKVLNWTLPWASMDAKERSFSELHLAPNVTLWLQCA